MILANYTPAPMLPKEEEKYTTRELISSAINQNTSFTKVLQQTNSFKEFDKDFTLSDEHSVSMLNEYSIEPKDYEKFADASSLSDLKTKLEFHNSNKREAQVIQSAGVAGLALSFVAGTADLPSWALGLGAGKIAQLGSNAYKLSNAGIRVNQAVAGGVSGVGSMGLLEYSLDNEATPEALAISGILGFGIGFATGGGMLIPSVRQAIENTGTNGVQVNVERRVDNMIGFMHSSADRLKASTNKLASDLGFKFNTSTRDVGLQDANTSADMLRLYHSDLNIYKKEYEAFRQEFKAINGRNMTLDDEKIFIEQSHRIDFEYNQVKSQTEESLLTPLREEKLKKLQEEYKAKIDSMTNATPQEKANITKQFNKNIAKTNKWKPDGEELKNLTKQVNQIASAKLPTLLASRDAMTQKFININQNFYKKFGSDIDTHDLNGLKGLDLSYYMPRAYDFDKIADNRDGAIEAFYQGLLSNFTTVDAKTMNGMKEYAESIVDKIINSKANYDAFDADVNILRGELVKTKYTPSNLKGRKLTLDASKLIGFMYDDIVHINSGYSRRVGGELALKRTFGIDNNNTAEKVAKENNISGDDLRYFTDAVNSVKGISEFDPNANSIPSRFVRIFNSVNHLNFGGWFGLNTATDLTNIVNDFGFNRTAKYLTADITESLKKGDMQQNRKLANYLGLACESFTNDKAILSGNESFGIGSNSLFEKGLSKLSAQMSRLSGLNMTVDIMDRVASMASLDYILTKDINSKHFVKTANRLGLSIDDVNAIRASNMATIEFTGIKNVNFDVLPSDLKYKLERGIRRAVEDTVLRANELDTPILLKEIGGNKWFAKAIFQFMRLPIIAYNKLGIKMKENFNLANAITATATGATIITLINQAKDIGKDEAKFDLTTKEGIKNNTVAVLERLPFMSAVSIPQTYVDILGRLGSSAIGEDYKGRPAVNFGITHNRLNDIAKTSGNLFNGELSRSDLLTATSFTPFHTLPYLQPFTNAFRDEVKDKGISDTRHIRFTSDDFSEFMGMEK